MDKSIFAVKDAVLRKCLRKKYSNGETLTKSALTRVKQSKMNPGDTHDFKYYMVSPRQKPW